MLERVDHELGGNEPEAHRLAGFHGAGHGLHEERMRAAVINHRVLKAGAQLREIGTDFDAIAQPRRLELLLHGCYRRHPLVCIPQVLPRFLRLHGSRLEHENARDDLQAVGDAVLHLLKQHLLLPQQLILFALRVAPSGYVFDRQQEQGRVGVFLLEYLARVEQKGAPSDGRKLVLDLVALDGAMLRNDIQGVADVRAVSDTTSMAVLSAE